MKVLMFLSFCAAIFMGCADSSEVAQSATKETVMRDGAKDGWLCLPFDAKDSAKFKITEGWKYSAEEQAIHGYDTHYGVDFAAPRGTPVYAAADGVMIGSFHTAVLDREYKGKKVGFGLGNFVQIFHPETGFFTLYAHLDRCADGVPIVKPVDQGNGKWNPSIVNETIEVMRKSAKPVKRGDLIGYIGDSGLSWGYSESPEAKRDPDVQKSWDETHLHFEVYKRIMGRKLDRTDPYGIYGEASKYQLEPPMSAGSLWLYGKGGMPDYARQ